MAKYKLTPRGEKALRLYKQAKKVVVGVAIGSVFAAAAYGLLSHVSKIDNSLLKNAPTSRQTDVKIKEDPNLLQKTDKVIETFKDPKAAFKRAKDHVNKNNPTMQGKTTKVVETSEGLYAVVERDRKKIEEAVDKTMNADRNNQSFIKRVTSAFKL